jgi:hypothetical protein
VLTEDDQKAVDDAFADDGLSAAAWLRFELWLRRWRYAHPDDDRTDLDLVDEYAAYDGD